MKARLVFLHASPAAIPPIAEFYRAHAPELSVVHLLDDGLMGCFRREDHEAVERRMAELLEYALRHECPQLAVLTCSAARMDLPEKLQSYSGIPVLRIDEALARRAVSIGSRLGVIVSFSPSLPAVEKLLREVAAREGRTLELRSVLVPEASAALLAGDAGRHDELLLAAIEGLRQQALDAIVLAQASMARLLPKIPPDAPPPVLSSLPLSLEAVRGVLAQRA